MTHKLYSAQSNYSISEQECLATFLAIKKFRVYAEGHEFKVIFDHASLKWLMSLMGLHSRLVIWTLKLQRINFSIKQRKGN